MQGILTALWFNWSFYRIFTAFPRGIAAFHRRGTGFEAMQETICMNENKTPQQAGQSHGAEIERTHEMYEKGTPAPGTRDAGKEGKDFVADTQAENGELGQSNTQATDPGKLNRGE